MLWCRYEGFWQFCITGFFRSYPSLLSIILVDLIILALGIDSFGFLTETVSSPVVFIASELLLISWSYLPSSDGVRYFRSYPSVEMFSECLGFADSSMLVLNLVLYLWIVPIVKVFLSSGFWLRITGSAVVIPTDPTASNKCNGPERACFYTSI